MWYFLHVLQSSRCVVMITSQTIMESDPLDHLYFLRHCADIMIISNDTVIVSLLSLIENILLNSQPMTALLTDLHDARLANHSAEMMQFLYFFICTR